MWVQSQGQEDPGEGQGNPLQYSCLENPMDRGAWQATVRRATQSQTPLKRLSMHTHGLFDAFILIHDLVSNEHSS